MFDITFVGPGCYLNVYSWTSSDIQSWLRKEVLTGENPDVHRVLALVQNCHLEKTFGQANS